MAKASALSGVAHNIAHHAASGLSCLSPHIAQALRGAGIETTQIELLEAEPYPQGALKLEPLRLALIALRETGQAILAKHGFAFADVSSIVLQVTPAPWDSQGYLLHARATIISNNGRTYDSGWIQ